MASFLRKLPFFVFAAALIVFSACSKSDDTDVHGGEDIAEYSYDVVDTNSESGGLSSYTPAYYSQAVNPQHDEDSVTDTPSDYVAGQPWYDPDGNEENAPEPDSHAEYMPENKMSEEYVADREEIPAENAPEPETPPEEQNKTDSENSGSQSYTVPQRQNTSKNASGNSIIGEYIKIGRYFYEENGKKKPIEWLVLNTYSDGSALLLSRFGLDSAAFDDQTDVTWDNSNVRAWLNTKFYGIAFSEEEKAGIRSTFVLNQDNADYKTKGGNNTYDKIFILNEDEMVRYLQNNDNLAARPTPYARFRGLLCYENDPAKCWQWMRPPGFSPRGLRGVDAAGGAGNYLAKFDWGMVRPAMVYETDKLPKNRKSSKKKKNSEKYSIGDIIEFGHYKYGENGSVKPIEWQIVEKYSDGAALVLSNYAIDSMRYDNARSGIWAESSIRKWLNSDFYDNAFNYADKQKILLTLTETSGMKTYDRVFLLTAEDIEKKLPNVASRRLVLTPYATQKNSRTNFYWLRSSRPDDYADFANNYKSEALINRPGKCSVILSSGGVRPAIMVDLNKIK